MLKNNALTLVKILAPHRCAKHTVTGIPSAGPSNESTTGQETNDRGKSYTSAPGSKWS